MMCFSSFFFMQRLNLLKHHPHSSVCAPSCVGPSLLHDAIKDNYFTPCLCVSVCVDDGWFMQPHLAESDWTLGPGEAAQLLHGELSVCTRLKQPSPHTYPTGSNVEHQAMYHDRQKRSHKQIFNTLHPVF